MPYSPQRFVAPDGTPLVIITDAEYGRLVAAAGQSCTIAPPPEQNAENSEHARDAEGTKLEEWSPLFGQFGG